MRSFSDQPGQEALINAAALFARLGSAVPSIELMGEMTEHLLREDVTGACRCYHRAYGEMLNSSARRVSGDLWRDELMAAVVQCPHPFGTAAAMGLKDEAAFQAMKERLGILGELSGLTTETVVAMAQTRQRGSRRDVISAKSAALWSGGPVPQGRPSEPEEEGMPALPLAFAGWKYGSPGLADVWESDEALEEIYLRLMETRDWPSLIEDLWNFFASYGTGNFLRYRAFRARGKGICPLPERVIAPLIPVSLYESQRGRLMENAIGFMRGEQRESLLLTGPGGLGKTALAVSLLHELPELRLVLAPGGELSGVPEIAEILGEQPHRFLLLLDDINPDGEEVRRLFSRMAGMSALPENILIWGTSRISGGAFGETLRFDYPTLDQFTVLVREIMEAKGYAADRQTVRNAAVDYQVDVRERLTFPGALALSTRLKG